MKNVVFVCLAAIGFSAFTEEQIFQTEELLIAGEKIHAICSFDQVDYFTTFSTQGEFLWEIPFAAKIISWKNEETQLFVLSQSRNGAAYFLSNIDTVTGKIVWEKGIFAPAPSTIPKLAQDLN